MAKKKTKTEILNGVDHYISTGECPNCGAKGVEGDGQLESTGNKAYQNCSCADCGYSFTDIYQLVGIYAAEGMGFTMVLPVVKDLLNDLGVDATSYVL
mgnify:CR=1 FL=1